MNKIFTVTKNELYRYFISPIAYVYLVCFLLLNGSISLYFGGIFTSGEATLFPMFSFLPWLLLLFIPGIAMRLWAEEFKSGSILQIISMPVSVNNFIWGKFLAAWLFCGISLLLTFPFVITVNILGNPDNWVIFNSYLGAFLLAGAMLAISQTASALSKNQVVSLVIGFFINFLFFLSGLEYVLGFFRNFAPDYIIDMISSFSFLSHSASFNRGIFEAKDLIFFLSLIFVFNFFTYIIITFKTSGTIPMLKTSSKLGGMIAVLLVFLCFIGINLFAVNTLRYPRIDFTAEQLYTPSVSTRKILNNLPSPVTAKVYYSKILGERDENMRQAFDNLRFILETYRRISNGKFSYRIYDTEPLSDAEDRAIQAGLLGLPVQDLNTAAYFGIVFVNENGYTRSIPFMPLARQSLLEQDITENILLLEYEPKTLGIYTSLPILGQSNNNLISQPWKIIDEIKKYYNIVEIKTPEDIKELDALMIVHPQKMTPEMEQKIYDYSLSGGKILAFFDIAPESLRLVGPQTYISQPSDYGTLPEKWGFRFNPDKVVADLENSSEISIDTPDYSGTTQDLIQFYVTKDNFFYNLPYLANLKRMLLTSVSVFTPTSDAPTYFIPLLKGSEQSQLQSSEVVFNNIHPAEILRNFQVDANPKYMAVQLIGKYPDKPFDIIAVGDSDMLYDSFWSTDYRIGNEIYSFPLLDNANFVLNALDYLTGNDSMFALRGKSKILRPYTELAKTQKQILRQYKIKEKDVFDKIAHIKAGLSEIWSKKDFEQRQNFTPDELSLINKIKNQLNEQRKELFNIRTSLLQNLRDTELLVKLFNIYAIPLVIVIILLIQSLKKRNIAPKSEHLKLNTRFLWLFIGTMLCLLSGILSINLLTAKDMPSYEGQPLFSNLSAQINQASIITLKNSHQELTFIKQDDLWRLKQQPDFLVNQNRIRSFLTALLQAEIYEKKADKIENLPRFGLLPLNDPNSKTVSIRLSDSKDNEIISFEVGNYNIDLSRGSLGAYIRFPKQFQVWLAAIELIDLDMDYHYWTYSTLWNLQFGRFSEINASTDADYIADIVSRLLNCQLTASAFTPSSEAILQISANGEYFQNLEMKFYEQDEKYYVQISLQDVKNNSVLQSFAKNSQSKTYEISSQNMEQIKNAVNHGTSK